MPLSFLRLFFFLGVSQDPWDLETRRGSFGRQRVPDIEEPPTVQVEVAPRGYGEPAQSAASTHRDDQLNAQARNALKSEQVELVSTLARMKAQGVELQNVLDVGAYKGQWTRLCQSIFPEAHYTLIEPIAYPELDAFPDVRRELLFSSEQEVDWHEARNTGDSIFRENTNFFAHVQPVRRR